MTVSTSLTAAAVAKDTDADADAAVLTPQTTTPHRVSARLELNQEDILLIGVGNFESILRQNLMLALSDRLDHLGLTGNNTDPNPEGLYPQLTVPTVTLSEVVDWGGVPVLLSSLFRRLGVGVGVVLVGRGFGVLSMAKMMSQRLRATQMTAALWRLPSARFCW